MFTMNAYCFWFSCFVLLNYKILEGGPNTDQNLCEFLMAAVTGDHSTHVIALEGGRPRCISLKLKLSHQQDCVPSGGPRGEFHFHAFFRAWRLPASLGSWPHHPVLCFCLCCSSSVEPRGWSVEPCGWSVEPRGWSVVVLASTGSSWLGALESARARNPSCPPA